MRARLRPHAVTPEDRSLTSLYTQAVEHLTRTLLGPRRGSIVPALVAIDVDDADALERAFDLAHFIERHVRIGIVEVHADWHAREFRFGQIRADAAAANDRRAVGAQAGDREKCERAGAPVSGNRNTSARKELRAQPRELQR